MNRNRDPGFSVFVGAGAELIERALRHAEAHNPKLAAELRRSVAEGRGHIELVLRTAPLPSVTAQHIEHGTEPEEVHIFAQFHDRAAEPVLQ